MKLTKKRAIALLGQLRREAVRNIKIAAERTENLIIGHWFAYNFLTVVYVLIGIPMLMLMHPVASQILLLFLVPFFALSFLSLFMRFEAADKNPSGFIMSEKLDDWIHAFFWLLFVVIFACFALILAFAELQIPDELILKAVEVLSWALPFFLANSTYQAFHIGRFLIRRKLYRAKARACFRIFSDVLSSSDQQKQVKKLSFFRNGMKSYNEYLKQRFGFMIREPQKYLNYVKFAISSKRHSHIIRIRESNRRLADLLKGESDLLTLHNSVKALMQESVLDREDMTEDFDFELGIRKWLSLHKDAVKVAISLLSLALVFIREIVRLL